MGIMNPDVIVLEKEGSRQTSWGHKTVDWPAHSDGD